MVNDATSRRSRSRSRSTTENNRPISRSTRDALSKESTIQSSSTSKLLHKRTPPTLEIRTKSENNKKLKMTPSPLRRSERNRNSSSSPSNSGSPGLKKKQDGERNCVRASSKLVVRKLDARGYRKAFKTQIRDYHEESNSLDKSTSEDGSRAGGKIDECSKANSLRCEEIPTDVTLPPVDAKAKDMCAESRLRTPEKELLENDATLDCTVPCNATTHETSSVPEGVQPDLHGKEVPQILAARNSSNESLIKKCIGHDNVENMTSSTVPCNATTHETSSVPERVQPDLHGKEAPQILAARNSSDESLIRKCVGHDNAENMTSSKRKSTSVDNCSDTSPTLVDDDNNNVIVDAGPSRLCCNIVETSGPCSKRIRGVSLSGEKKDQSKFINDVDQPHSKSNDENSSAREKEGTYGDSLERPQANNVETEKIRNQQRSLHLSLKPEIAKLCEILLLPDNVKNMVDKFLEYTMNNYQICTEPVSILQAFQLSLCWTIASLLSHKLDFTASLILAKRHLNFDCEKDVVSKIKAKLWDLKDGFLLLTGKSDVIGSPKASETPDTVHLNPEVIEMVELTEKDISRNIKKNQMRKSEWRKLLQMQQEFKWRSEKQLATEKAEFRRRCNVELAFIRSGSSNDVTKTEKLKVFQIECGKRNRELERQHEVHLKDLEVKQLKERREFEESRADLFGKPDNAPIILLPAPNTSSSVVGQDTVTLFLPPFDRDICDGGTSNVSNAEVAPAVHKTISSNDDSSRQVNGFIDGVKNMASSNNASTLNSPLSNENSESGVNVTSTSSGQISAHLLEGDEGNGSNNVVTLKSPPNHERTGDINVTCSSNGLISAQLHEGDEGNGSNNVVTLKSPPNHERIGDVNVTCSSNGQISAQLDQGDEGNGSKNVVSPKSPPNRERTGDGNVLDRDGEVHVEMPTTANIAPLSMQQLSPVESLPSPADILPANETNDISMVMEPPEQVRQIPSSGILSSNRDLSNLHLVTRTEDSQVPEASIDVYVEMPTTANITPLSMQPLSPAESPPSLADILPANQTSHVSMAMEPPEQAQQLPSSGRVVVPPASSMDLDSFMPHGVSAQSSDTRNLSFPRVINNHPIQTAAQSTSRMVPSLCRDPLSHELEKIRKRTEQHMKNHEDMKLQMKCDFEKEYEELRRKYELKYKELEGEFQEARKNQDTILQFVYAHKILADALMAKYPKVTQQDAGSPQLSYQLPRQRSASQPSLVATPSPRGPPAANLQNSYTTTGSATTTLRGSPAGSLQPVVGPPPRGPPSGNLQSVVRPPPMQAATGSQTVMRPPPMLAATGSQTVGRPLPMQATYSTSGIFSGASARRPFINSISSTSGNLQAGGEIRAPAPHIQPYRPPTSVPVSSIYTAPNAMPSHSAQDNIPPSSLPFSQLPPGPIPQSDTHGGHWHENRDGFSTPNMSAVDLRADTNSQSSTNLPNALPRMPDLASLNPSKSGPSSTPANSDQEAAPPDVVCLSDDE